MKLIPPAIVAANARRGLKYRRMAGGRGGTRTGVQRAINLSNRDSLSPDTIKRMKAFFDRHKGNERIDKGKEPWEDRGYVSWLLWGGDEGYEWAKRKVKEMKRKNPENPHGYLQKHMYNFSRKYPGWHSIASYDTKTKNVAKRLNEKRLIDLVEYENGSMQFRKKQIKRKNPKKLKVRDEYNTSVDVLNERDRAYIILYDNITGETLMELWDEAVGEAIEEGFINPKNIHESILLWADELGIIKYG